MQSIGLLRTVEQSSINEQDDLNNSLIPCPHQCALSSSVTEVSAIVTLFRLSCFPLTFFVDTGPEKRSFNFGAHFNTHRNLSGGVK